MAKAKRRPMKGSTAAAKQTVAAIRAESGGAKPSPSEITNEKATFLVPVELMAELRVASVDVPRRAFGPSLSSLVVRGVQSELAKLRRDWNEGEPFESSGPVQTQKGRPPKN